MSPESAAAASEAKLHAHQHASRAEGTIATAAPTAPTTRLATAPTRTTRPAARHVSGNHTARDRPRAEFASSGE